LRISGCGDEERKPKGNGVGRRGMDAGLRKMEGGGNNICAS